MKLSKKINLLIALSILCAFFFALGARYIRVSSKAITAFVIGSVLGLVCILDLIRIILLSSFESKRKKNKRSFLKIVDSVNDNFKTLTHEVMEQKFEQRLRNNDIIFKGTLSYDVITGVDKITNEPSFFIRLRLKEGRMIFLSCTRKVVKFINFINEKEHKEDKEISLDNSEYSDIIYEIEKEIEKLI